MGRRGSIPLSRNHPKTGAVMQPRTLLMLLAGFVGGLIVSACSPAATCTPATCGGCCDSSGKCQSGATPDFCGSNGVACAHCGTGTVCQQNECRAGSTGGGGGTTGGGGGATGGGTGGGTTGGGTGGGTTGGGTGGGGGCRMITMLETAQTNLGLAEYRSFSSSVGHYNYAGSIYLVSGGNPDSFRMEMVYPNDVVPSFPYTETFTSATRYRNCIACAIFYESCNPQTTALPEGIPRAGGFDDHHPRRSLHRGAGCRLGDERALQRVGSRQRHRGRNGLRDRQHHRALGHRLERRRRGASSLRRLRAPGAGASWAPPAPTRGA